MIARPGRDRDGCKPRRLVVSRLLDSASVFHRPPSSTFHNIIIIMTVIMIVRMIMMMKLMLMIMMRRRINIVIMRYDPKTKACKV